MKDLLTAREVQDLLKVDRTTIYRMLRDGRLRGVKIGRQWRFPADALAPLLEKQGPGNRTAPGGATAILPLHCVSGIQRVFAEVAELGAVTTDVDGEPISDISNSCRFCELILESDKGRQGCIASWRRLARQSSNQPEFHTCHAGLRYARARVEIRGELQAMLFAGQFYLEPPDEPEQTRRLQRLASDYGIEPNALRDAARSLTVLPRAKQERITRWLEQVARTFEDIGEERAALMSRLRSISEMSRV